MVTKKTWKEFRDSGLLFLVNQFLHVFGWSIVISVDSNGEIVDVYPARTKYRGFSEDAVERGYRNATRYLKENIDELLEEVDSDE